MSLLPVGISGEEAGYQISRSLRFNSADSAYLNRTPASAGNRRTFTFSCWIKIKGDAGNYYLLDSTNGTAEATIQLDGTNANFRYIEFDGSVTQLAVISPALRDPSAWYHLIMAIDTTQATQANRCKMYINGVQQTVTFSAGFAQNADLNLNKAQAHFLGRRGGNYNDRYLNGYLTEINFIDGQALTPSSFGETNPTTGVWQPKKYTGTYGTNGFYLNFSDNSGTTSTTLGKDRAGSNNWTPNNFSVTAGAGNDSLVDTPTNYGTDTGAGGQVRGNYCTWNAIDKDSDITLSNGNLDASQTANNGIAKATFGVSSGKWYWEVTATSSFVMVGVAKDTTAVTDAYVGSAATSYGYFSTNGQKYNNGSGSAYGASYTTNDVIGVALDLDAGTLVFYKNNSSQGTAYSSLSGTFFPAIGNNQVNTCVANFGQRPFAYTAPSGFKALCTQNLPEPTIKKGGEYFNTVLYTGNNTTQSITGVGFQPDWVWIKSRSTTYPNLVFDAVRTASKVLVTDSTQAETTYAGFTSFNADGFSVSTNGGATGATNDGSTTYVAWNWKANGAGSSNTAGTITSTVSVNTTSGFSIVTYTGNGSAGATVGHGLGVAPKLLIIKRRDGADDWQVKYVADNYYLKLNGTNAASTSYPDYTATSSVINLGYTWINNSGQTYVAYCFAPVSGFSAFGSYTGNGSADGPFVYTGFRPAYVLIKRTNNVGNWCLFDDKRNGYNLTDNYLYPNLASAEESGVLGMDILSNGFKCRTNTAGFNGSGDTIIYAAFAEVPMKFALGR